MGEALRQIAIVREDEQTFTLRVEPADVEEPRQMQRQKVKDCIASIWIASGGDEPGWLVQDDVQLLLRAHHLAADFDVIRLVRFVTKIGADAAVDGHAAAGDQLVTMASRACAGCGKEAVQAHGGK